MAHLGNLERVVAVKALTTFELSRQVLGVGSPCVMAGAVGERDDGDALVEAALANDGWREIRDPLLAGLLAAVGEATSFEDLLKRLDTAKIDSAPLIEKLALATTKARLSGGSAD